MSLRIAVASLLVIASACAEEDYWLRESLPFVDVRLGYALVPRPDVYDTTITPSPAMNVAAFGVETTVEDGRAPALTYSIVGGTIDPFGPLFGAEIVYVSDSQKVTKQTVAGVDQALTSDPSNLQYRTFGGNIMAGVGLALGRQVHLEGLALLGVGTLDLDFPNSVATFQNDGEGWYWNAGVRGGVYFTWRKLVVGALIEVNRLAYKAEANWSNVNTSVDDSLTGVGGRIEIGYHIQ